MRDLRVYGKIILKWILEEPYVKLVTKFIWFSIRASGEHL